MLEKRRGLTTVALVAGMALTAAACGGSSSPGGTTGGGTTAIKEGGTLHLLGAGDIDHMDPASAYYTVSYTLLRAITRQLVSYPNDKDATKANTPVADMVTAIPTPTDGGKTYAFTIKDGVAWNIKGTPRQVTGADAVRGFKRLCNPVQPTGAQGYFAGVIVGMKEYCAAEGKIASTIPAIKDFINKHEISGVSATGNTVTIKLVQPAGDFLNILALPFSSPMPVESLDYLPDSPQFRQNFISDGPYIITKYTADHGIELARNPAWKKATDSLRAAHVNNISIVQGTDEVPVQQQLVAGTADLEWDTTVPTASVPGLRSSNDPNLFLEDNGSTNPYLVINTQSPNAGGALKNLKVRQALNYAVNKQNIIQVLGGPTLFKPLGQILTPPILGYQQFDPYATPNSAGDPAKAKALLKDAGFPTLTLTYLYRNKGKAPLIAQTLQADLAKSGITLKLKQVPPADFYTKHLSKPSATKAGDWDLAGPGWNPDWAGNAARSFFVPLLDGRGCGEGSTNYNCYNNPAVNALIDKALAESDQKKAGDFWHQADVLTMADAPWVPITTGKTPYYHGSRVMNWVYFPFANNADITNVWLKDGK
ncbi:MAG: ABC transporter substrate-binding protein [Actinomycetota bacterium]|nr:ABC transporter substrate-binding protein [Actinomycetota bacterium]